MNIYLNIFCLQRNLNIVFWTLDFWIVFSNGTVYILITDTISDIRIMGNCTKTKNKKTLSKGMQIIDTREVSCQTK
jgi:hypothetical protein